MKSKTSELGRTIGVRRLFGTEPFTRQIYFVTLVFLPGKSTIETAESLRSFSDICA